MKSPLKGRLDEFREHEHRMETAIAAAFGIDADLFKDVELKRADVQLLVDEKAAPMVDEPEPWPENAPPMKNKGRIKGWGPDQAKATFLGRFAELKGN